MTRRFVVREKQALVAKLMEFLAGDFSFVSFEGRFSDLPLASFPEVSNHETKLLKRNTLWPEQDFVVVPLRPGTWEALRSALGTFPFKRVLHVQIERNGVLEFGAYDNFSTMSLFFGRSLEHTLIPELIKADILKVE